jgi:hypothetical protein
MPASDLAIVCDWLLRRNHAAVVLEWVHEERARNDFNLLQRHLMALMLLNRWQETSRLLADNTFPMHPVFQEVSRAIVAHQEKHEEGVIGYLTAAILAAHDDPDLTLFVANYAEGLNKPLVAVQALQRLMVDPVRAPRIATRIFQLLAPLKESMPMMRVVDQATKFASEDPKLLNEQAWWHLIVEGHQDKFLRQAQSLHESDPKDPYYAATLALAQLLGTQLEAAFTTLDPWSDQLETAPARLRLVYTACLGANGQGVAARSLASSLADLTLKDREQALIQPWL